MSIAARARDWRNFAAKGRRQRNVVIGATIVLGVALYCLVVPVVSGFDPDRQDLANRLQPPGGDHWLGTDSLGRDLMTRIAFGGITSLQVAMLSVGIGATIGILLGLVSGYLGGLVDRLVTALITVLMAFPALMLALFIASLLGAGFISIVVAITSTNIAIFARLTRGETMRIRAEPYVEASLTLGARMDRVLRRHILANIWPPLIVALTLRFATAVLTEATISYLGLGIPPPTPTWGGIILEGQRVLERAIWISAGPGVLIMAAVLGLNLLGDGLRDVLDPRLRGRIGVGDRASSMEGASV